MPKSDSARKPKLKLPKVWVMLSEIRYPKPTIYVAGCSIRKAELPTAGGTVHPYAPLQPQRRCVWKLQHNSVTNGYTACGWWMDRDSTLKFCARCGGRIVRRKS